MGNPPHALWLFGPGLASRLAEPRVLLVLLTTTAVAVVVAKRLRGSLVLAVLASVALWFVFALTILNRGGLSDAGAQGLLSCATTDPLVLNAEGVGNLLLFAPFGFLAGASVGRPLLVTAAGLLVSASIEVTQAVGSLGRCDSSDVVRNGAGLLVGALLGAALRRYAQSTPPVAASLVDR